MASSVFLKIKAINTVLPQCIRHCRYSNTLAHKVVESHRKTKLAHDAEADQEDQVIHAPHTYKFVYPEFLPDPTWWKRDRIREKLERMDMLRRRKVSDIPEFYVGTLMAVTVADPYAPNKRNRFVGICIDRGGTGLRAHFTLRNIVDGQGVEIMYELYNPTVQKMEVLKLEKRLDDQLYYLRDAPQEYSTVPFDMKPIPHPPGALVPVNPMKIKLGPRPWHDRWERHELRGLEDLGLPERFYERAREIAKPWEKYDLMKHYRENINEKETAEIMADIYKAVKDTKKPTTRKRPVRQQ